MHRYFYLALCMCLFSPITLTARMSRAYRVFNATTVPITIGETAHVNIAPKAMIAFARPHRQSVEWHYNSATAEGQFDTDILGGLKNPVVIIEAGKGDPNSFKEAYAIEYDEWERRRDNYYWDEEKKRKFESGLASDEQPLSSSSSSAQSSTSSETLSSSSTTEKPTTTGGLND
jgi:hypothetical protein